MVFKSNILQIIFFGSILFFFAHSCKKEINRIEPELPFNPFDTITYQEIIEEGIAIDSNSFLGLYEYIFKPTCAVPACHDGSFEPDFRTVQSAYNTLIYKSVIKNDTEGSFTYRVVPGDTSKSWLYERITTDDAVLGRMPLYDSLLSNEIALITNWILEGAQDVMGNSASLVNIQNPSTSGFIAYLNDTTGSRQDDNRLNIVSPMILPNNETIEIWLSTYDFDADSNFYWGYNLTYNKARISDNAYLFTDYVEYDMEVEPGVSPFIGPVYWDSSYTTYYFHHFKINTDDFIPGHIYFLRFYVKDADHPDPFEIPDKGTNPYLLTYFSFIVEE